MLNLIMVMQCAEGLSDQQTAEAVRSRIDWKYALGLALTDPGFHYSILITYRERLSAGGAGQQFFGEMLTPFRARGLLRARGQQRTDSARVLAAIRGLKRTPTLRPQALAALRAHVAPALAPLLLIGAPTRSQQIPSAKMRDSSTLPGLWQNPSKMAVAQGRRFC